MGEVLKDEVFKIKLSVLLQFDWFYIGSYLNIPNDYLEAIKNDHINFPDQEKKAHAMIKKWLNVDKVPTLKKLEKAIQSIPKEDLLANVKVLANGFLNESLNSPSNTSKRNSSLNSGGFSTTPTVLPKDVSKTVFLSNALKNFYCNTYNKIKVIQPKLNNYSEVDFSKQFVNLYVVDEADVQKDAIYIKELDKFSKKQMSTPSVLFEKHLKDLSQPNEIFLISGIAGVGKTWLLRKLLLDWSKNIILKNIDFVFYFECRQLSLPDLQISNINELLNVFYKDVFKGYSNSLNLIQSNVSILFIIDGLNEFEYFDQLISSTHYSSHNIPILNVFTEICKKRAVISGRVNTISQFKKELLCNKNKLTVRVMGYDKEGIKKYLKKKWTKKTKKAVKTILYESPIANAMAKVPFFLSCILTTVADFQKYKNKCITMTELYACNFLCIFQRYKENRKAVCKIMKEIINKQDILYLCKMAFFFFNKNRITFSESEIQTFISGFDVNESGQSKKRFLLKNDFIEKLKVNCNYYYQFCQPALMELLVSVHAYHNFSGEEIMENPKLRNCLSIICGLLNTDEDSFIKHLANLTNSNTGKISLNHVIDVIPTGINSNLEYKDTQKLLMQCFFESQATITDDIKASIDERKWKLSINNTKTSYEVSCEKYFVNHFVNSGGKLTSLEIDKILLTVEERELLSQCSKNVENIHIMRSFRFPIDQITKRWLGDK